MLLPTRSWLQSILAYACILGCLGATFTTETQSAPSADKWRSVSLPSRAIDVTSISNAFWVCGVNEMIAKSVDGGQTWQVKHQKADGEVLLHVAFIQEDLGYAAGTNGILLWTKDGGETWLESHSDSATSFQISCIKQS